MNWIIIKIINVYQKWISPYKGYKCAYGYLHGKESCSQAVKNIIRDKGYFKGRALITEQFRMCKDAHKKLLIKIDQENPVDKKRKRDCTLVDFCSCIPFDF